MDPLADTDLQPLYDIVCSRRLVFHGADYDLRLLRRTGRFEPVDLFDTMIAARLVGKTAFGLAALVKEYFGIELSKASQKANWAIRPLPQEMLEYAINDTRYLLEIADILESDLRRLGRLEWFQESRDRMIASAREVKERDESTVWRITGSSALSPRAQAVLRILWFWRDAEAKAWDRPSFHVIGNEDMIRVADQVTRGDAYSTPRMNGRRRKSFEVVLALALTIVLPVRLQFHDDIGILLLLYVGEPFRHPLYGRHRRPHRVPHLLPLLLLQWLDALNPFDHINP